VHYEGVGTSGPLTGAGMPDFYTEFHTLNGASVQGHLVSILCHGVFERHPRARLILMEGGLVGYVGVLWRLDQNWRSTRSEIPWCRRRPSEYVWDHVRFTTQPLEEPDDPAQLADALRPLRPERTLVYATDYPHWDFDDPDQTLRTLPAEWREPIRFRTAAELFGVPVPAAA
jgi:predicted TIM-barrel fold metal-dependent hydrolase